MHLANQLQQMRLRSSSATDLLLSLKPSNSTLRSPTRLSPTSTLILQRRRCSAPPKPSTTLSNLAKCCQVLGLLRTNFPHNSRASVVLDHAQSRSLEQKTGVYNFKELQAKAKRRWKLRPPHLDHATYIGPVEIRQTESKDRGLFVTKAVKAGDLLLCEKSRYTCFRRPPGRRTIRYSAGNSRQLKTTPYIYGTLIVMSEIRLA
jgi:hypothetical protein